MALDQRVQNSQHVFGLVDRAAYFGKVQQDSSWHLVYIMIIDHSSYITCGLCSLARCLKMARLFPFVDPKCDHMQRNAVALIESRNFIFSLPTLNNRSWGVVNHPSLERERLEFLGDALIGSTISEELFRCRPNEGPGFYTCARMVLTANSTFAHLMRKAGRYRLGDPVKQAGDTFETILAAFHFEMGPEAFQDYVRHYFVPLIQSVGTAYDQYRQKTRKFRALKNQRLAIKSERRPSDHFGFKLGKKIRKHPPKQRGASQPPRSFLPARSGRLASLPGHVDSRKLPNPKACPVVIDLTLDGDNDGATSSHLNIWRPTIPQASSSSTVVTPKVFSALDNLQGRAEITANANVKAPESLKTGTIQETTSSSHTWPPIRRNARLPTFGPPFPTLPSSSTANHSAQQNTQNNTIFCSHQPSILGSIGSPIITTRPIRTNGRLPSIPSSSIANHSVQQNVQNDITPCSKQASILGSIDNPISID